MENEIFFCKSSVGKSFVRTPKNPVDSNIIYQNGDGKFYCMTHRTWEDGKISNLDIYTNEITLETECGNKAEGFFADSTLFSYRVKINNNESCPLLIEENYIDTNTLEKYEAGKIFLKKIPLKAHQKCYGKTYLNKFFSHGDLIFDEFENSYIVKNYAEKLLWRYQKNKNHLMSEKPVLPNIPDLDQDDRLELLATFPCEPGIAALYNTFPVKKIRSDDKNGYFKLCEIAGIKSWPFLRKKFLENPYNLIVARNINYYGFKDKNVINDILENKYCRCFFSANQLAETEWNHEGMKFFLEKVLEKRSERAVWNLLLRNLKSYVPEIARQNYEEEERQPATQEVFDNEDGTISQREIDLLLGAIDENYVPSGNPANYIRDLKDAAKMFQDYFEYLPAEVVQSVIRDGLSKYNHDVLSKYNPKLKNVEFKYTKNRLELEDNILEYEFYLPKESFDLAEIGSSLHNCVGSYGDSVMQNRCTIVVAKKYDLPVLCIEVRNLKTVHQVRADCNAMPKGEPLEAFELWRVKHHLLFSGNSW